MLEENQVIIPCNFFSGSQNVTWKSIDPPILLHPKLSPKNSLHSLFWENCVLHTSKRKNRIEKAKRDVGNDFFYFLRKLPKKHYGKFTNKELSHKIQMQMYFFVKFFGFRAVFRIQGCFQWLSSAFRSGVMAKHRIQSIDSSCREP